MLWSWQLGAPRSCGWSGQLNTPIGPYGVAGDSAAQPGRPQVLEQKLKDHCVSFLLAAEYLAEAGPVECAMAGFGVAYCVPGQDRPGGGAGDDRRDLEAVCGGVGRAQAGQFRGGDPVAEQGVDDELVPEFGGAEDLAAGVAAGEELVARLPQSEGPAAGEPDAACYPGGGPAARSARLCHAGAQACGQGEQGIADEHGGVVVAPGDLASFQQGRGQQVGARGDGNRGEGEQRGVPVQGRAENGKHVHGRGSSGRRRIGWPGSDWTNGSASTGPYRVANATRCAPRLRLNSEKPASCCAAIRLSRPSSRCS